MRRLVWRCRADNLVREDTRSYLINFVNLFIRKKRDKRRVRRHIKTCKLFSI